MVGVGGSEQRGMRQPPRRRPVTRAFRPGRTRARSSPRDVISRGPGEQGEPGEAVQVEQVQKGAEVGARVVQLDAAAVMAVAGGGDVQRAGGGDAEELQLPQVHLQGGDCGRRSTGGAEGGDAVLSTSRLLRSNSPPSARR